MRLKSAEKQWNFDSVDDEFLVSFEQNLFCHHIKKVFPMEEKQRFSYVQKILSNFLLTSVFGSSEALIF